ncbi:putative lipoprotein [Pedobacter sp. BAL39]|uniref:DUF4296 domain-containing protein n=1 Tax=Pedobacter sp. BAL39 TaxID=391596 RepID=UPI000155AC60|nr:DUF4296 domain-containing protein [Pedobacter sp. BAL39]EDM34464.1 putative lipoprotein [Pedobacter sp. BAL39]
MRNFLYIALLILSLSGCKPGVPGDIIPASEMSSVLIDIHVADGIIGNIPTPDSAKKIASAYYNGIFKKYGIDSAKYVKSMNYYNRNPKVMDEIYTRVVVNLGHQKDLISKADSLSSVKMMAESKLKMQRDSLKRAGPEAQVKMLLRDTATKTIDYVQFKMNYKLPNK